MQNLRIVFMGSPEFAIPSLEAIHESSHQILAVVSNPDKRRGRRGKPVPTDVKRRAIELGYKTIDTEDVRSVEFVSVLKELKPDLLIVVAFRILPPSVLAIPKMGSVNLHASLLPKYRGAAPIHWAVINGESETGCTVFYLDEKVDTGKIIRQEKIEIGPMETTGDVYNKLKVLGAEMLAETVNDIADGTAEGVPQKDELATPAPKLFTENTKIDFNQTVEKVHNLIRGLNPFPIAWCWYKDEKMQIYESKPGRSINDEPGALIRENGNLYVACSDGLLELKKLQLPGTARLSGQDFINGYDISVKLQ
jgi:methionyl-tRNA formyltransferase